MIDQIAALNLSYLNELLDYSEQTKEQFNNLRKFLKKENCVFKGEPMSFLLKPNFLSPKQAKLMQYAVEKMSAALNKFIKLYLENEKIQKIMKFSKIENELFSIDPGYSIPLVIARHDAFLNDYNLKFLEFNCDSPAGIAYSDVMEDGFKDLLLNYKFSNFWKLEYINSQDLFFDSFFKCYKEFRESHPSFPSNPTIAIVDWLDSACYSEFELLQKFFEGKGYSTIITDPRLVKLKGQNLVVNDKPIHLIYRRVITRELIEKLDEVKDFVQGIKEGLACICNPFRSFIVGNKKVLALLKEPRFQHIFDQEEIDLIEKLIPWTKILKDNKVTYQGFTVDLRTFISENKDKFVIKPASSYGGKNVFLGNETDQNLWEKKIKANIKSEDWVVQEYVNIPQEIYPEIGKTVKLKLKKVNVNPFAFCGKYGGTISRVSDSSVINVSAGGGLVPTMKSIKKKDIELV
jgi:hypothetical protein